MVTKKKKKSGGALPLLFSAVGFGIAAALLAMLYLNAKEKALRESIKGKEEQNVSVVVATQDLSRGSAVDSSYFALREIPANFVHEDAVYPNEFEKYEGRSLTANLGKGKALLKSFLDEEFPIDFSDTLKPGRRALAVTVDEINSITGFLRPGNYVDLLVNIPYSESGFDPSLYSAGLYSELPEGIDTSDISPTKLEAVTSELTDDEITELVSQLSPGDVIIPVLHNVKVIATGKDPYVESLDHLRQPQMRTDTNFTTVVVDVSPEQVALISAAQDKGDMLAVLRNRNDKSGSSFSSISSRDLFLNAQKMAEEEKARAARTATPAGVDQFGNLVDADGNKILDKEALAKAGYTINENGQIVDKDGNVIDPNDIVVASDGTVMTKEQLAASGLTVNENGQLVDKDGNVVDATDVVIGPDGKVMTKEQLAAAGLSVNENGEIVDANGKVISADDLITTSDGTVMSKSQLAAAGLSVNENGEIVDANGNVVDPDKIKIASDGSVLNEEMLKAAGLSINENGEIVDANGNVIDPSELVTSADGTVMLASADKEGKTYEYIIGGASTDGMPKVQTVEIPEPELELPVAN